MTWNFEYPPRNGSTPRKAQMTGDKIYRAVEIRPFPHSCEQRHQLEPQPYFLMFAHWSGMRERSIGCSCILLITLASAFNHCRVKLRIVCGCLMNAWTECQKIMKQPSSCCSMDFMEQMPGWWRVLEVSKAHCLLLSSLRVTSLMKRRRERRKSRSLKIL